MLTNLDPVGGRALLVVALLRLRVVQRVVAEERAERFEPVAVPDQPIPVVVPDLVAEVTENRAIGFTHLLTGLLPKGVSRLRDVDSDQPVTVTGEHRLFRRARLERKRQAAGRRSRLDRKSECRETVDETPLCRFEPNPCQTRLGGLEVRDHVVERARLTERAVILRRDRPVAGVVFLVVAAQANALSGGRGREGDEFGDGFGLCAVRGFKRAQGIQFRKIRESPAALFAPRVLEVENLLATRTREQLHGCAHCIAQANTAEDRRGSALARALRMKHRQLLRAIHQSEINRYGHRH